jgi:hypothetical protein
VVVARDGKRTVLSMLNDYKGPLSEFVLVVPTPVALAQGQVRIADKAVFERLDAYSSPRLAEYHDNDPCQFNFEWGVPIRYPLESRFDVHADQRYAKLASTLRNTKPLWRLGG